MRILILSANTGGGHNSTAEALGGQLEKFNVSYEIVDSLAYISEKASHFISWGHTYLYRNLPKLFGVGYRLEEAHTSKMMYEYISKGAAVLQDKLSAEPFDAVLCVHIFAGMMMTEIRKKFGNHIPFYFVATDYTCSPGATSIEADAYFIPHRMLFSEFVRNMIPADRMYATGIPVRLEFYDEIDKAEAKKQLDLPAQSKTVLLTCGSMGCGHLDKNALMMREQLPEDCCLVVLCGKNEKLYGQLLPYASETMRILPFCREIPLYMSASDICLTKPGGLMTSESIVKRLPMILINAVPGCESRNFDFLTQEGVAFGAKNWKQAISLTVSALSDEKLLEGQREAMEKFSPVVATEQICKYVLKNIAK